MTPYFQSDSITIYCADVLDGLRELPDESVHMCVTSPPYYGLRTYLPVGHEDKGKEIGLEATPQAWVDKMVEVFRGIKRVLRNDGTVWLNVGDLFIKKQLQGMPWRLAFALQEDGWILRSDIILAKRAPMPESVRDRPTSAHEHLFLFVKQGRYYWDAEAVREPAQNWGTRDRSAMRGGTTDPKLKHYGLENGNSEASGRNLRNVWWLSPEPQAFAHFATYPRALVRPCIRAGTSERGVCPKCGKGWVRVVETVAGVSKPCPKTQMAHEARGGHGILGGTVGKSGSGRTDGYSQTLGWKPGCSCDVGEPVPATVLDPFMGSGTTTLVALEEGRRCIGIDLSEEYCALAVKRLMDKAPLLAAAGRGSDS